MALPPDSPVSPVTSAADASLRPRLWALLAGLLVFRALYLLLYPYSLISDEAYYWDWGRHLDWGYYSKPPLIGWLTALAGWLGGDSVFGLRIFAVLLGTGTLAALAALADRLHGPRAALWTVLAVALTPANAAMNLFLTIDAPLLFFWSMALYLGWRVVETSGRWPWLLGWGFCLGMGYLTKQMMLVLPLLFLAFLLAIRHPLWRRPRLWATWLFSLAFLAPPLLWNAAHGWATFRHTGENLAAPEEAVSMADRLGWLASYVVTQASLVGPLLFGAALTAAVVVLRRWPRLSSSDRYLWLLSAPGLLTFLPLSLRQEINPNWPAAFYPALLLLTVGWLLGLGLRATRPRVLLLRSSVAVGAALALLVYTSPWLLRALGKEGTGLDPSVRMQAWPQVAEAVQQAREEVSPDRWPFVYVIRHREPASHLAFLLPDQPRVFLFDDDGAIGSQYEFWPGPDASLSGRPALLVARGEVAAVPVGLAARFASVERLRVIRIPVNPRRDRVFTLFVGRDFHSSP